MMNDLVRTVRKKQTWRSGEQAPQSGLYLAVARVVMRDHPIEIPPSQQTYASLAAGLPFPRHMNQRAQFALWEKASPVGKSHFTSEIVPKSGVYKVVGHCVPRLVEVPLAAQHQLAEAFVAGAGFFRVDGFDSIWVWLGPLPRELNYAAILQGQEISRPPQSPNFEWARKFLRLPIGFTENDLKCRYHRVAKALHPDLNRDRNARERDAATVAFDLAKQAVDLLRQSLSADHGSLLATHATYSSPTNHTTF